MPRLNLISVSTEEKQCVCGWVCVFGHFVDVFFQSFVGLSSCVQDHSKYLTHPPSVVVFSSLIPMFTWSSIVSDVVCDCEAVV